MPESIKGRGARDNPKNRFEKLGNPVCDEFDQTLALDDPEISPKTEIISDNARSILTKNNSPDVGFDYSMNVYRGCEHGCAYCYARPTHEYLGLSSGLDFETKILVKHAAPELLRKELASRSWTPQTIVMSGVTDCYQPLEKKLGLTRQCLEVLAECGNPVFIITKNALVTRDIEVLGRLAAQEAVGVCLSVTTLSDDLCGVLEPRTSRPHARLAAIRKLAEAGIPVGVNVAPIIPGLTDQEVPAILKASKEAGASFAGYTIVRLPYSVKDIFADWLSQHFPEKRDKILGRITEMRGGQLNDSHFGSRMRGWGEYAGQIRSLFEVWHKRLKFEKHPELSTASFKRPLLPGDQLEFSC